jgi:hypothetical protein
MIPGIDSMLTQAGLDENKKESGARLLYRKNAAPLLFIL